MDMKPIAGVNLDGLVGGFHVSLMHSLSLVFVIFKVAVENSIRVC